MRTLLGVFLLLHGVVRIAAYAGLMTDAYPPFRLDMGGDEPDTSISLPKPKSGT